MPQSTTNAQANQSQTNFKENQSAQKHQSQNNPNAPNAPQSQNQANTKQSTKVMITGDDILIEYVTRLVRHLGNSQPEVMQAYQTERVEKFVSHYVWHMPDLP